MARIFQGTSHLGQFRLLVLGIMAGAPGDLAQLLFEILHGALARREGLAELLARVVHLREFPIQFGALGAHARAFIVESGDDLAVHFARDEKLGADAVGCDAELLRLPRIRGDGFAEVALGFIERGHCLVAFRTRGCRERLVPGGGLQARIEFGA